MQQVSVEEAMRMGVERHQAGRFAEAEAIYREILKRYPQHAGTLHLMGVLAHQGGRSDVAEDFIRRALAVVPNEPTYLANLGRVLNRLGRQEEAVGIFRRALQTLNDPDIWMDLGVALDGLGRWEESRVAYQEAVRLKPDLAAAVCNMGVGFMSMGRFEEAKQAFLRALAIDPRMLAAMGNLGHLCELRREFAEALGWYERAIAVDANHPQIHYNVGVALGELERLPEAAAAYRRALAIRREYWQAHNNLANALKLMGRFEEAIVHYREAVRLMPECAEAWTNLGGILHSRAEHEESLRCHERALTMNPKQGKVHGNLLYTLLFQPGWGAMRIREMHDAWNRKYCEALRAEARPHGNDRTVGRRLRVGFVSADFRQHVVGRNMLPLFTGRNREAFEFICYPSVVTPDEITGQFRGLADEWHDIFKLSDEAASEKIRADRIDILMDWGLHMAGTRLMAFARKPAPVQVTFAGYPGTTGLWAMDYRLTDGYLDPPGEHDGWYSEKSVRMGETFWVFDPAGVIVAVNELPADRLGRITFGCLNNFCKVNDGIIEIWSRVMRRVGDSRLMLLSAEGSHRDAMRAKFERLGVGGERVEFVAARPRAEYLKWYHEIDMGLDTVPYNGHSTSLDSFWMGVPVVTLVGETVVGRAGLCQLMNLKMPELIGRTAEEFVEIAVGLAEDRGRLREMRRGLRGRMEGSRLMDAGKWVGEVEGALRGMWRAWCRG